MDPTIKAPLASATRDDLELRTDPTRSTGSIRNATPSADAEQLGKRCAIMALAPQTWHDQWVNRQQLLSRIGKRHAILYSTGGWFVWDVRSDAWKQAALLGNMTMSDNVCVDESPRYLLRWPRFASIDRAVMRLQVRRWTRWLRRQGNLPLIAQVCFPAYFPYVEMLKPDRIVYHVYDRYDHMPGWTAELERNERRLLRDADLVFCASELMAQALREKVERPIEVLPNAADVEAFFSAQSQAFEPPDLAAIPRPRIGWTGSLHPQIDYELVGALATRQPDWHFVFVGNKVAAVDERAERAYRQCTTLKNVHFLGYKRHGEVPAYVVNMDVNAMWYRLSDETWIKANSPLKLHEYLAAGHPIVAVDLPSVRPFSSLVRIAAGVDEWERAIQEALATGGPGTAAQRRAIASENSWNARARTLGQWLADLASR